MSQDYTDSRLREIVYLGEMTDQYTREASSKIARRIKTALNRHRLSTDFTESEEQALGLKSYKFPISGVELRHQTLAGNKCLIILAFSCTPNRHVRKDVLEAACQSK